MSAERAAADHRLEVASNMVRPLRDEIIDLMRENERLTAEVEHLRLALSRTSRAMAELAMAATDATERKAA